MKQHSLLSEKTTDSEEMTIQGNGRFSFLSLVRLRDFRLLWLGQAISLLGDQFYLIALPWLALQLTGDAFAVGTVLAVAGIPRALFMLIGGALTDRFSPRLMMLNTNLARMGLVGLLAALVWSGAIQLWMLYLFALLFGLVDAFFYPAQSAIVPQVVPKIGLQLGNTLIQVTAQLSLFLGPVLAGILIAFFSGASEAGSVRLSGLAVAFGIDALTFLASAATLWLMNCGKPTPTKTTESEDENLFKAIGIALRIVSGDAILLALTIVNAAIATLMSGVIAVGIPVLANLRFAEGAAAFGLMMSAMGVGSLVGMGLASVMPKPRQGFFGPMLLGMTAVSALGIILYSFVGTTWTAAANTFLIGLANGYVMILLITWLQMRIPSAMLGRIMSLIMFSSVGLAPISTAAAGFFINLNLNAFFIGAGILLLMVLMMAVSHPAVRAMPSNPSP